MKSSSWVYVCISSFAGFIFRLLYRNKVYFSEALPQGGAILAANHTSFFDPPIIAGTWPTEMHFLASNYLFKVPILGAIIRACNAHPIARGEGDIGAFRLIAKLLKEGKKVNIFPEGTRSKSGELQGLKRGVAKLSFISHTPVIPIYIEGTYKIWGRSRKFPKLWGRTRVFYGKALYPEKYGYMEKREAEELLTSDLRESILQLQDIAAKMTRTSTKLP
ncbi:MAG: lysophospholipid acyltransferase family protein [Chlamydiae bacterium]|nr:lysophospholipid acyltransferase family protein [Chlamydiota bacterium]